MRVPATVSADLAAIDARVLDLAMAQSSDIQQRLESSNVTIIDGTARIEGEGVVLVETAEGTQRIETDAILLAVGAHPRVSPDAQPDGERILTWKQVYALQELPEHMIVVGSGVTGAEFASAYNGLGASVTLVSSRDRVLPGEDVDAANVIEDVFTRRGMNVMGNSRMASVERTETGVLVTLTDGRTVEGSHCLLALGSIPNTEGLGLEDVGVRLDDGGFIKVDRVSRTTARGHLCRRRLHRRPDAGLGRRAAGPHRDVAPAGRRSAPARSRQGLQQRLHLARRSRRSACRRSRSRRAICSIDVAMLPLASNARAKMQGVHDGFVKIFCRGGMGVVIGGVVVGPKASELIHALSLAVSASLTVDQVADAFTVYPSMSGSVAEAARRLHRTD